MNVLILSQHFWPESFRINDLSEMLASREINVSVLTGKPNYPEGKFYAGYGMWKIYREQLNDVEVVRVPVIRRKRGRAIHLVLNYLSFVFFATLLGPFLLRKKKIDVIFVYGTSPILQAIPAVILKWCKGAKLAIWVQDLWPESLEATGFVKQSMILRMVGRVTQWVYKHADSLLVQSKGFIAPVSRLAAPEKIHYYPNSAENVFSPGKVERCPIPEIHDCFSVVFAGALGMAQALDVILDCAERLRHLPEIRFFVVGYGSRHDWVENQISQRKLQNVRLPGRYPIEAMPAILGAASALLVTLKDEPIFRYTIPSKIQAYMASGRPIIACLNGEGARIVDEAGAGLTCKAEDSEQLAQRVIELYQMPPETRAALGRQGQRYFQANFESQKLTQELIGHFESLLQRA